MSDVMALLKDRRVKAEAKLARAIKTLESLKKELADLQAAERVIGEITGESPESSAAPTSISERDKEMAKLLEPDPDNAISPVDLYARYLEATGDTINMDVFRTALWRLQKKHIQGDERLWVVRSEHGKYWREAASRDDDFNELLG